MEQGEQSTQYFYRHFRSHQSNTHISELHTTEDSSLPPTSDPSDISLFATEHFTDLWSSSPPFTHSPLSQFIPQLPIHSIIHFALPISPLEISKAIQSKDDNSAPGPDGLTYALYKTFLPSMTSILSQIANLIAHGSLPPPSWSET